MKTRILFLMLLTMSFASMAQISGTVKSAIDQQPIPYVNIWIVDENIGTTADEEGKFILPTPKDNHALIFNALGYETKTVALADLKVVIELRPKVIELAEVLVSQPKRKLSLKVDEIDINASNGSISSGSNTNPNIMAKFFPFDSLYSNTPYLKNVSILTKSGVDKAKFNIRFYEATKEGSPGAEIYLSNIFGFAKKGVGVVEIDISKLDILFPDKGLYIAMEVLAIPQNKFQYEFMLDPPKRKPTEIRYSYEPKLGAKIGDRSNSTWIYESGGWKKLSGKMNVNSSLKNIVPAIEITLTN